MGYEDEENHSELASYPDSEEVGDSNGGCPVGFSKGRGLGKFPWRHKHHGNDLETCKGVPGLWQGQRVLTLALPKPAVLGESVGMV